MQQLKTDFGLDVHAVPGKGYRLAQPLRLLDRDQLAASQGRSAWPIDVLDVVDSTSTEVYRRLVAGARPPFAVIAEQQSAGKGRRGRQWISPFGQNIYYSVVMEFTSGLEALDGLSLTVGVAVLEALQSLGVEGLGLKWPNDLLIANRKVAGILIELHGDPADVCRAVIGVGINVNMRAADVIDQPWTSLSNACHRDFDRTELVLRLTESLHACVAEHRQGGFRALRSRWENAHAWRGEAVALLAGNSKMSGVALGVDDRGALRLMGPDGERSYSGGELSLRLDS
ncbi:bifunctional ligase/repressor BirA [Pseudomonas matsuisoli]|uniref:biotin--[biotin carboxyl-carrier protein] ligase n=1 Tax=Pseudomonas matsuisoli TaxID=1515666 RepID=A0A917Q183_9PSED|nr:bifunctional ligase/repressor BirA [Pseudomonas matsuisoli]